jgi:hypothetical protein
MLQCRIVWLGDPKLNTLHKFEFPFFIFEKNHLPQSHEWGHLFSYVEQDESALLVVNR